MNKPTEEEMEAARERLARAVRRAKAVLKPGDRLRVDKCPGGLRVITFAGWNGDRIVSKSGRGGFLASCIDRLNGEPVDFGALDGK